MERQGLIARRAKAKQTPLQCKDGDGHVAAVTNAEEPRGETQTNKILPVYHGLRQSKSVGGDSSRQLRAVQRREAPERQEGLAPGRAVSAEFRGEGGFPS